MALPVVVLVATTTLAIMADRRATAGVTAVEHAYEVRVGIGEVLRDLVDAETAARGYLLTGEADVLDPYVAATAALSVDLADLTQEMTASSTQRARVEVLTPLIVERMSLLRRLVEEGPITTDADRARSIPTLLHGNDLMKRIRVELGGMEEEETSLLRERQEERVRAERISSVAQLVALPIGVILSLTLVMVVSSRVVRRVRRIEQNALQLEAGEPLTAPDDSKDELGRLSRLMVETGTRLMETQDELRHLATVDPLTGVANRRGFLPLAEFQLQVSRREHRPTAMAFIDVDGLKPVNDRCGHATGDDLLREVAALLQDTVRASDIVARLGGDEFCVLLTGESGFDPETAIQRLEHTFEWANRLPARKYPISVSIGLARFDPNGSGDTTDQLIRRADHAMYETKRGKQVNAAATGAA